MEISERQIEELKQQIIEEITNKPKKVRLALQYMKELKNIFYEKAGLKSSPYTQWYAIYNMTPHLLGYSNISSIPNEKADEVKEVATYLMNRVLEAYKHEKTKIKSDN